MYKKGDKGKYQLVVSQKASKRLQMNVKVIIRKTKSMSFDARITKINEVQRGWINYFQGTNIYIKLRDFNGWLRNRLRYCIWKDCKKPKRKRKNLI
jgi:RNA-directed DNA polymerase